MKIIGHEEEKQIIRKFLDKNYHSYSFLFEGHECIGKKAIALLTAKAFLCEKKYAFGCGECQSCKLATNTIINEYQEKQENIHPFIKIIKPENQKEIKIDQIREITKFLKTKSSGKAVIIDNSEKMNIESSNALLKTLEEPPENTLIILITTNQNKLLPTIISRTKIIKFKPLKKEEIEEILILKGISENKAHNLSLISEGSLCLPLLIAEKEHIYKYAKDIYTILLLKQIHIESIINISETIEKLEFYEIEKMLEIVDILLYKKLINGKLDIYFFENSVKEIKKAKESIQKGVKKKLAIQSMLFNLIGYKN